MHFRQPWRKEEKKRKIHTSCHIVSDLYPKMLTGADRILLQFIKGLTQSVFGDWL